MAWNLESQDDVGWPLSHLFGSNRWTPGATEGVTVAGGNGKGSRVALKCGCMSTAEWFVVVWRDATEC